MAVVHEDGDQWGIEVEADDEAPPSSSGVVAAHEERGLQQAGLRRKYEVEKTQVADKDKVVVGADESVDDLAAQFNAL